jgi:hypothetical protein
MRWRSWPGQTFVNVGSGDGFIPSYFGDHPAQDSQLFLGCPALGRLLNNHLQAGEPGGGCIDVLDEAGILSSVGYTSDLR